MELWQQIISNALKDENISESIFSKIDLNKLLNSTCYITLKRIKEIIESHSLTEVNCILKKLIIFIFFKIEVEKFYIMLYNYISYK